MIKGFEPRLYQQTILAKAVALNTMVVLPTGLGKTLIFVMLADYRLRSYPGSKVLMLAPTKPLAQQHLRSVEAHLELPEKRVCLLTGEVAPEKRVELWKQSNLIFSTPQTIENDLIANRVGLQEVSLLCFDECHRAVGDYSYVWIAKQYVEQAKFPRILGLTASPGSELEKITEITQNLFIEHIEVRSYEDADVAPYVKQIQISFVEVELPERFKLIKGYLEASLKRKLNTAATLLGPQAKVYPGMSKKELLLLQRGLFAARGQRDPMELKAISLLAEAIKLQHALELLETQGAYALFSYLSRIQEEASTTRVKAVINLVNDKDFRAAYYLAQLLVEEKIEHPKHQKLIEIVDTETRAKPDIKIIVFNQYRDSAKRLEEAINSLSCARARLFVGQAKKSGTGLSQRLQKQMLEDFSGGKFNVLISTSIGEEGLDIPSVDLVIFYEPVPSAIRSIQRRGRTGRHEEGRVIVLVAKGTRDAAFKWVSHHKEKRMHRLLKEIRTRLSALPDSAKPQPDKPSQSNLKSFIPKQNSSVRLMADSREGGSPVLKGLRELGAEIELRKLECGDYLCSGEVGVEFKLYSDFLESIIDRRLLTQAKQLRECFQKPVMIIQDEGEPQYNRMLSRASICGALASVALGYRIPVFQTKNPRESAELLYALARAEQENGNNAEFSPHHSKPLSQREQQEYLVSALPGIGPRLAKPLLRHFGSVRRVFSATKEELMQVKLIGPKKAEEISRLTSSLYQESENI